MSRKRRQSKNPSANHRSESEATTAVLSSEGSSLTSAQWTILRKKILVDQKNQTFAEVFGPPAGQGTIYRWGLATAIDAPCDIQMHWLTRMAVGATVSGKRFCQIDPESMVREFQESLSRTPTKLTDAWSAVVWSAAMPSLLDHLDEHQWWSLLGSIQEFRDGLLNDDVTLPSSLLGVAEIGVTLAHGLRALPSCRRLAGSSLEAFRKWCEQDDLAAFAVISNPQECRLALASLLRLRRLHRVVTHETQAKKDKQQRNGVSNKSKRSRGGAFEKAIDQIGVELTTWVAALTRHGGVQAFSSVCARELSDDTSELGLLTLAAELDVECLLPAMKAALGKGQTKGRLAWQVSLPEAMLHDDDAKLACLLPEWDIRRGRTVIEYQGRQTRLELTAGKTALISGRCETTILIDGQHVEPVSDWVATCEYSDDDVHYLELEQTLEGGYVLQRQVMVVREDRCCFFADAVVQGILRKHVPIAGSSDQELDANRNITSSSLPEIRYQIRFPLVEGIDAAPEIETNELFLRDQRQRAMLLPLSAGEWKSGPTETSLKVTDDNHLLLAARGRGQLFVPLWIDLSRKRFAAKRTWRQLTVGENMKLVPQQNAAAYRIQVGKLQWILYRSMASSAPRTFFGKHMIADFYCARFDAKSETYEDLITVEENPS